MQHQNQEILAIIILGALLALLLVGFIIVISFLYQKRQQQHKIELVTMQEDYDQQILRVQFEMQEATLAEISNKLHDSIKNNINGVINDITAIRMKWQKNMIDTKQAFAEIELHEKKLTEVREDVRLTSHSLSNDKLSKVGLIDTIAFETNRIMRNNRQLKITDNINTEKIYIFSQEQSIFLYRIFQEMIGNVLTHSQATNIEVYANLEDNNIFKLLVADNGIGFNVAEKTKSKLSGIGLSGMQKRALQIGAVLQIDSKQHIGTTIKIELPLPLPANIEKNDNKKIQYSFD
jgi:two-component system, NarL family, sensor kinase